MCTCQTCQPIKWQYRPRTQGHCLDHSSTADLERVLRKAFDLPVEPWLSSHSCNLPWLVFETARDEPIVPFVMAKGGNLPSIVSLMQRSPLTLALTLHVRWSLPASPAAPTSASRRGVTCAGHERGFTKRAAAESWEPSCDALIHHESPAVPSTKQTPQPPPLFICLFFVSLCSP